MTVYLIFSFYVFFFSLISKLSTYCFKFLISMKAINRKMTGKVVATAFLRTEPAWNFLCTLTCVCSMLFHCDSKVKDCNLQGSQIIFKFSRKLFLSENFLSLFWNLYLFLKLICWSGAEFSWKRRSYRVQEACQYEI